MRYFSPSTGGFYSEAIHGAPLMAAPLTPRQAKAGKRPEMIPNPGCTLPGDAVPISEERYAELMAAQASGSAIVVKAGKPMATERVPDPAERRALRRRQRDRRLAASDWTQLNDTLIDDLDLKQAWATYREALRDLDIEGDDWPVKPGHAEPAAS